MRLPLKLAVALLKDRNGVIDIDLPMTGSLDDPKFRMGPLIWKAFVGLLTKAATAPFALLGSLFGGGEEMNLIEFEPGSAALDAGRAGEDRVHRQGADRAARRCSSRCPLPIRRTSIARRSNAQRVEGLLRSLPKSTTRRWPIRRGASNCW